MAVSTRPISFSIALTIDEPIHLRIRSAPISTAALNSIATVSAPIQASRRSGWREASSSTVAIADGPASSGTASGKISGSRPWPSDA